ncbi:hypothetical protein BLNAU_5881 [Blattamonas nauphoetae]|uniref:Uncharacterized protein n=1 Tax=Blattamonas nauphoetae TaxID=2049346 RepID=A0ABQ9Y5S3_9EUKA|nr:hypothetical protein BLNAU_5881 [Blattamonas nauphoetae]
MSKQTWSKGALLIGLRSFSAIFLFLADHSGKRYNEDSLEMRTSITFLWIALLNDQPGTGQLQVLFVWKAELSTLSPLIEEKKQRTNQLVWDDAQSPEVETRTFQSKSGTAGCTCDIHVFSAIPGRFDSSSLDFQCLAIIQRQLPKSCLSNPQSSESEALCPPSLLNPTAKERAISADDFDD